MFYHNINPVLLELGPLQIRYYGLFYALGFVIAYFLISYLAKRKALPINKDDVADMTIRLNRVQGGDWGDEGLFVFESLVQEDKAPETQGMVVSDASKGNNLLIFVAAAIGGLLGLLVVFALKRKKTSM